MKDEDACVDIDGGSNIAQQGEVSLSKDGEISSFKGSCEGDIVLEYSCKGSGLVEEGINCANGCVDGECIDSAVQQTLCFSNSPNTCEILSCGEGMS